MSQLSTVMGTKISRFAGRIASIWLGRRNICNYITHPVCRITDSYWSTDETTLRKVEDTPIETQYLCIIVMLIRWSKIWNNGLSEIRFSCDWESINFIFVLQWCRLTITYLETWNSSRHQHSHTRISLHRQCIHSYWWVANKEGLVVDYSMYAAKT